MVVNVSDLGNHFDSLLKKLFEIVGRKTARQNDRAVNDVDLE
jgi:hypothetical protein